MQRFVDKKQRQVCSNICTIRYTVFEVKKMNFGIKLQILRKDKRLSQEDLAEQLGVSRQAVSKWERGEGYPEIDTVIVISNLFGVTLDYLLKDNDEDVSSTIEEGIVLSTVELDDFLLFKKRNAFIIATATMVIIMSLSLVVFFENNSLAIGAMLILVALAVGSMIMVGILSEKYEYLEKKPILLKSNDLERMKEKQEKYRITFAKMIAAGIFLIILGTAVVATFEGGLQFVFVTNPTSFTILRRGAATGYLLWAVAIAVFMFIYSGITRETYQQICNSKEYMKEIEEEEQESKYYAITMPVASVIYVILGMLFDLWNQGWVIFPVVAILTFAFTELKR